jgi:uncharacterized protein (TIGR02594 family)
METNVNQLIVIKALEYYGTKEIPGDGDNPLVVRMFEDIGFPSEHDSTAWCSCFMNWVAWQLGLERSGKLDARSWLSVGDPVMVTSNEPVQGDIVVFWRGTKDGWQGHVGIFIADVDGYIYTLGGNEADMVEIAPYNKAQVLGFRRLNKIMEAKLFALRGKDFLKGLILAVITAVVTFLTDALQSGITIDAVFYKRIAVAAVIAFLAYLVKNFFTNSNDQFAKPETKPPTQ